MIKKNIFVCMVAGLLPAVSAAQWLWLDDAGRRVYSDQPPPPAIPMTRVLRQPGGPVPAGAAASVSPASETPGAASPASAPSAAARTAPARSAPASAPPPSADDPVRALQEQNAQLRAAHCVRLRAAWTTLTSGQRVARTLPHGEREILDDAGRAAERQRLQDALASDCPAG